MATSHQECIGQNGKSSKTDLEQHEESDYQCASWVEIIDITESLAVELKTASCVVDFQEIEIRKKTIAEFVDRQRKKLEIKAHQVEK
ncbi:hypothetical protein QUA20_16085 [Microcoleus sp. Pol7_A1]